MIDIRHLYKRYHNHHGSQWVLEDINLSIPAGVSVGLLGRNGAGKSTLLRLIGGMDTPDRGEIVRASRVSWPIGLAGGFQGSMTGRQNVKFVARIHGANDEIEEIIAAVESFADIGRAFDEPIKTYSSGMRSRLAFGLSLAFDFDVYLSDEATAVGDRHFKQKASEAFKARIGRASLIMVSHGEGVLREFCQAGILLDRGRAFWFDEIEAAIEAYHSAGDGYAPPRPATPRNLEEAKRALAEANARFDAAREALDAAGDSAAETAATPEETLRWRLDDARERVHEARRQVQQFTARKGRKVGPRGQERPTANNTSPDKTSAKAKRS